MELLKGNFSLHFENVFFYDVNYGKLQFCQTYLWIADVISNFFIMGQWHVRERDKFANWVLTPTRIRSGPIVVSYHYLEHTIIEEIIYSTPSHFISVAESFV